MATGEIDDAETAMCENGVRIGVEAGTVRAAMREHVAHSRRRGDLVSADAF